jgi:hypothetical protein
MQRIQSSSIYKITFLFLLTLSTACAPKPNSAQAANPVEVTSTPLLLTSESPTEAATNIPVTNTPSQASDWPIYTLEAELPNSPAQLSLYTQVIPAELPDEERLAEIMEQLQITGTVSTHTSEAGESVLAVTGDSGSFRLVSDDPFLLAIENAPHLLSSDAPAVVLRPDVRAQVAEEFLSARGLLNFPHLIEPPRMSRDRDHAIRVVPLIDGYPLYDYDPLNGRLLVWFNAAGEISVVTWRPIKLMAGDPVNIVPANVAWDQLVNGNILGGEDPGECWQATVFDRNEPYGVATPVSSSACLNVSGGSGRSYKAATIDEVSLVYFAHDLSLGMSPFAFAADSSARTVFPLWRFSGITNDGRELIVLWPAIQAP